MEQLDIKNIFKLLDKYLLDANEERSLIICGGASLILKGILNRATEDVDVLLPRIDKKLKDISIRISKQLNIGENWINGGAAQYSFCLLQGWENRTENIYNGKALKVSSIARIDQLSMKFYAVFDRPRDLDDLKSLKPQKSEIETVAKHMKTITHLQHDSNWSKKVDVLALSLIENADG